MSLSMVIGLFENFLIVITGPPTDTGGSTMLTREPSASLVSSIGDASFTLLLDLAAIICATSESFSRDVKLPLNLDMMPSFSVNIRSYEFTMISVISPSSNIV